MSRTSPDELDGQPISECELNSLWEAAKWAPSFRNLQPWRFVYANRTDKEWQTLFDLLWPLNQQWCVNAGALVLVVSHKFYAYKDKELEEPTNSFDTGMACMQLALEANGRGIVAHFMAGFEYDKAYQVLGIPKETHHVEAMIALGRRPPKHERTMNEPVSQREPLSTLVQHGHFVIDRIVKKPHQ